MKKNILIADDSESILAVVSATLEEDYDVTTALDGAEAINKLNEDIKFDLIITDLNMPHKDGIEVIKSARSQERYGLIPILILTTESQVQKKQEAKDAGATGWIVKPFQPENLRAVVKKVLR